MRKNDPKTKEQLLDRMLSFDFDGDIRHLGVEAASIVRVSPNTLRLSFPASGTVFELEVHRPREFSKAVARQVSGEERSFAPTGGLRQLREEERTEVEVPAPRPARRPSKEDRKQA